MNVKILCRAKSLFALQLQLGNSQAGSGLQPEPYVENIEPQNREYRMSKKIPISSFYIPCSIFDIGLLVKNIKNNLALMGVRGGCVVFSFTPHPASPIKGDFASQVLCDLFVLYSYVQSKMPDCGFKFAI